MSGKTEKGKDELLVMTGRRSVDPMRWSG